jgi:glycosyltransferase involved in cell wall biosynthesis
MFAGYQENPWDYYNAADAMVFASREEGFGTVVIEAMARGLPVLVRRLPGVNDAFVEEGASGFLFDDAGSFQAGARALASDAALRRTMGERGRAVVAEHYDIDEVAARYLAIYGHPVDAVAA